jgi:Uma2 family endonuclease
MSIATTLDDQPISVPVDALSPEGFRRWAASPAFPRQAKITRSDKGVLIEGTVPEVADLPFSVCIPPSAGTPAGFSEWATSDAFPQRGRISFLQQEIIVDMSPEELHKHSVVKLEISHVVNTLVREGDLGRFYPDGALLRNEDGQLSTEPDALFATWDTLQSGRLELTQRRGRVDEYTELVGTPDWVLEIVSRSSIRKDKRLLRELYHRAGVAEYWLVDALGEQIDLQILVRQPDGYTAAPREDGWSHSPVFGRRFRLHRRHDRLGDWQYTLDVAE